MKERKPEKGKTRNLRMKIREVADKCLIFASDELCDKIEEELEKGITPEFLEKVRSAMIKASRSPVQK